MGYTAKAIANFFLDIAKENKVQITPLKMQKLVYISHGWHLALSNGQPLVNDEHAEAWEYGPVFPSLYHEIKEYGKDPIKEYATELVWKKDSFDFSLFVPNVREDDVDIHNFLNKIWEVYGNFTALQLSDMTHKLNTPWQKTWQENKGMKNTHIPNELIHTYYGELTEKKSGD